MAIGRLPDFLDAKLRHQSVTQQRLMLPLPVTQQFVQWEMKVTPGSVIPEMRGDQTSERVVK